MNVEFILVAIDPDGDRTVIFTSDSFSGTVYRAFDELTETLVQMACDDDDLNTDRVRDQIGELTIEREKFHQDDTTPTMEAFKQQFRNNSSVTVKFPYSIEDILRLEVMRYVAP